MEKTNETQDNEEIKLVDTDFTPEKELKVGIFAGNYKGELKTMLAIRVGKCVCHLQKGNEKFDEEIDLLLNAKSKLPALAYKKEIMGIGWHDFIKLCIKDLGLFSKQLTNSIDKEAE